VIETTPSAGEGQIIGHLKAEHRMNRNYLKGFEGDRANAVLAAAGYNFRLLLRWLALLFRRPNPARPAHPIFSPNPNLSAARNA
jgi:hypothetical protein